MSPRADINWEEGVIYLIHFDKPFAHAQHYLGYCHDFEARMERHRRGTGSNLIKKIQEVGITWKVVRTWKPASPKVEAELKRYHNNKALCPLCQKELAFRKAERLRTLRRSARSQESPKARYDKAAHE